MTLLEVEQAIEEVIGQRLMYISIPEKSDWTKAKQYTIKFIDPSTMEEVMFFSESNAFPGMGWTRSYQNENESHADMMDVEIRKLYKYLTNPEYKDIIIKKYKSTFRG